MKVLLINGSPRENGCTYRALDEIAQTLSRDFIETEFLHLGKREIRGCIACGQCKALGRCIFDDIVNQAAEKMETCDAMVVGSPVYFASANGTLFSFLDRLFYANRRSFFHKPAACVVSARRAGATASMDALLKYFSISQMPIVTSSYWPMVHGNTPEEVEKDLEGLQTMRNLARNLAWILKAIHLGKQNGLQPPDNNTAVHTNFIR
ncbi:MAG: flavodoxin family protein [Proteobacteria bacterium]|nr:flavodoxin family protein [Pseudomonadota bacterium]